MSEIKNPLPVQFTVRLSQEEADYINENLHLIRGEDDQMPRSKIFVNAVARAISNVKPKEIVKEVPLPELVQENEQLRQTIEGLRKTNDDLLARVNELLDEREQAIMLKLKPQFKEYLWGIMEILKRDGKASGYEDVIELMLRVFHQNGWFILDDNDRNYLLNLKKQQNHE